MSNFDPLTSDLAAIDPAQIQLWLTEALAAYHQVATGGRVEVATYTQGDGTKSVTFTRANIQLLQAWIAKLNAQLGYTTRRPIRVIY